MPRVPHPFNYHRNLGKWMALDTNTDFLPERYCPAIADEVVLTTPRLVADSLSALVGAASLIDAQILSAGRTAPPRNQADFGLTALTGLGAVHPGYDGNDKLVFGELTATPPAAFEYTDYNAAIDMYSEPEDPYIDGHIGVGLTYQDRLVAVCLGIASSDGPLITQLQDVSSKWDAHLNQPKDKYSSGLHAGIDWKQTLMRAWQRVVPAVLYEVGSYAEVMPAQIQSALNNEWLRFVDSEFIRRPLPEDRREFIAHIHAKLAQFERVYDATALALGGTLDPTTNNYVLPAIQDN